MVLKAIFASVLAGIVAGCGVRYSAELPRFDPKKYRVNCGGGDMILIVDEMANFSLFNAAFSPVVARKLEKNGKFKNAKFMPPNDRYDPLFGRVMDAIRAGERGFKFKNCEVKEIENIPK